MGNSLGLRIPKTLAREVGVEAGSYVDLTVRDGELCVRPTLARRVTLAAMLHRVTSANRHAAIETGAPVGRED